VNEGICDEDSSGAGFIDPQGVYHPLSELGVEIHGQYAQKYLDSKSGLSSEAERKAFEKFSKGGWEGPEPFLVRRLHWVRVANFRHYSGPEMSSVADDEWNNLVSAIISLIKECSKTEQNFIYAYQREDTGWDSLEEPNAKRFVLALRQRGKIAPSKIAQFREAKKK